MPHERSDRVWEAYRQSSEKLDYFAVGLAGALTAYLGEKLTIMALGYNASTVELLAVLSLGLSMFAGFQRIEWNIVVLVGNHARLHHGEAAGSLASMATESEAFLNIATGGVLSRGEALLRAQQHRHASDVMDSQAHRAIKRAERAYRWRNRLLYAGIVLLVGSKVLAAIGY